MTHVRVYVGAYGSVYWCAGTPHVSDFFVFVLLAAAAGSCRLYHTVLQALVLSTWWQPRVAQQACVDHYILCMC